MREIKFRAKQVDTGKWLYGDLLQPNYERFLKNKDIGNFLDEYKISILEKDFIRNDYVIDPETIGQFTGLCDKNGKEIYEGDIVHCWDTIAKCETWAVVEFGNPNAEYTWGWQLRKIKGSKGVNLDILCWVECEETNAYCEIIGNIYDNPELLKGE